MIFAASIAAPALDPPTLEDKALAYVNFVFAPKEGVAPPAQTDMMARAMTPPAVKQVVNQVAATQGAWLSAGKTRRAKEGPYDLVFVGMKFERGALSAKVVFDDQGRVAGFFLVPPGAQEDAKPPAYADPKKFREERTEVVSDGFRLPAMFTLPAEGKAFPVVVFVHGSGPNDMDESIGPNKVFRDVAWALACQGIASLRYDKRTLVYGAKLDAAKMTMKEETIDDACAAAKLVAGDPRFDPKRVILVGHSMGGYLAPRILESAPEFAAAVLMAGSNRPLMEMMEEQMNHIALEDGAIDKAEKDQIEAVRISARAIDRGLPAGGALGGISKAYLDDMKAYDPLGAAAKLDRPMLIAQGGRDYQVLAEKDFANWKKALQGREKVVFLLYPALNHLFIAGEGTSYPGEYSKPGNVDEVFINDVARWIKSGYRL